MRTQSYSKLITENTGVGLTRNQPTKELENSSSVLGEAHTDISGYKNKQKNMHFYDLEPCLQCQNQTKNQIIEDCILAHFMEWLQCCWGFFPGFFQQTKYTSVLLILGLRKSK